MSRACILSAGGDVLIAAMVLKLWKERWYDEIDRMYVCYNNNCGVPQPTVSEFLARVSEDPKVHVIYHPIGVGNGTPIKEGALVSQEDLILLLEDDGFIFTKGEVDGAFQQIESAKIDALGSPRFSCGTEIGRALGKKYNLDYSGYGDVGPNFWPNFFFCKRTDLLATDLNFASYHFVKDQHYPELDHTMTVDEFGDTFVWACVQMRHNGVRFGNIPQKHASPGEIEEKELGTANWSSPIRWIHGGSLSTSWGGYLSGATPDVSNENAVLELETRVAFWTICSDVITGFGSFKEGYKQGIENLITVGQLNRGRINKKIEIYKDLLHV